MGRSAAVLDVSAKTRCATAAMFLALLGLVATADGRASEGAAEPSALTAFMPTDLLEAALADPHAVFDVVVQGKGRRSATDVAGSVSEARTQSPGRGAGLRRRLSAVAGVSAQLTGRQLVRLASKDGILAITPDAPVKVVSFLSSRQQWPYVSGVARSWLGVMTGTLDLPAIAVVDSGIDASRTDFGTRVIEQVRLTGLTPNAPGDGRGHGTFVASIAAGAATSYTGAAPNAELVSVDVTDDQGMALTSDVIAAADWILANKDRLGIRVANFSLHATAPASIRFDPLDRAVERLWFSGVVVVAAAGNFAVNGAASGVPYAPANDPFIITVGAADVAGSLSTSNDFAAPWSAFGYTLDGFSKPELAAPGRYMVGAVSAGATLALERPDRIVAPGYMQMSGTSFAAPVVAGAAAYVLARHPSWTPDQVKGALMLTAKPTPAAVPMSLGVGQVNAAAAVDVVNPPNPNLALRPYVVADPLGGPVPVFDAASWTNAAVGNASWDAASWTDASWTNASWTNASWTNASWTNASWTNASFTSASWTNASWTNASWTNASWTNVSVSGASFTASAEDDSITGGGYWMSDEELAAAEAQFGIVVAP